jgi:hypothetical protein
MKRNILIIAIIISIFIMVSCVPLSDLPDTKDVVGTKTLIERIGDIEIWQIKNNTVGVIRTCILVIAPSNVDLECP